MFATPDITTADSERMKAWLSRLPDTASVANFVGSAEIQRIGLHFDIAGLHGIEWVTLRVFRALEACT